MHLFKTALLKYWHNKRFVRQNILVWLIVYAAFLLLNLIFNGLSYNSAYLQITVATFFIAAIFYAHFFLCAAYFQKSNKIFFLLCSIVFLFYSALMYWLAVNDYDKIIGKVSFSKNTFFILRAFTSTLYYLVVIAIATVYWSLKNASEKKQESKKAQTELIFKNTSLEQQKLILQRDLFQSENNFLRAQINPHFLYNCLNFLYSKTFQQQPNVADGIMLLSQIMRYSLTDFSDANGLANVEDELTHIENVIKINRLRFENSLQIEFMVEGNTAGKKIAPMLLITLVENVFKHGDLQDNDFPAMIHCEINAVTNSLHFTTSNKSNKIRSADSSGLGIHNIRQRLNLLYNNDFTLNLTEHNSIFKTELIVPYINTL
jgi:two-component system LytT family sensor kinase